MHSLPEKGGQMHQFGIIQEAAQEAVGSLLGIMVHDSIMRLIARRRARELEREAIHLRERLEHISHETSEAASGARLSSSRIIDSVSPSTAPDTDVPPHQPISGDSSQANRLTQPLHERVYSRTSRDLNGVQVSRTDIGDLFRLFFSDYAPWLPIFDTQLSPDNCYSQSPLLFWAIIGVSSRSYDKNPTLTSALSQNILDMAFLSPLASSSPIHTIRALLLLITWPFPKGPRKNDSNFALAGLMLHMALENGLHGPASCHQHLWTKAVDASSIKRPDLWAYCVSRYQRVCIHKGQLGRSIADLHPGPRNYLFHDLTPKLLFELKSFDILIRFCAAVLQNGLETMNVDQERSLDILLNVFEDQMVDLETSMPLGKSSNSLQSSFLTVQRC